MKKLLSVMAVTLLIMSMFAGCSGKDKIVGNWEAESFILNGEEVSIEEANAMSPDVQLQNMSLTFDEDGTVRYNVYILGSDGMTFDGNWEKLEGEDNTYEAYINGAIASVRIEGSTLEFSDYSDTWYFHKK